MTVMTIVLAFPQHFDVYEGCRSTVDPKHHNNTDFRPSKASFEPRSWMFHLQIPLSVLLACLPSTTESSRHSIKICVMALPASNPCVTLQAICQSLATLALSFKRPRVRCPYEEQYVYIHHDGSFQSDLLMYSFDAAVYLSSNAYD